MEPSLDRERQQAHALLDLLPAEKLNAVLSLLEVMVEPLSSLLALAPLEEEELTSETAEALDRARASLARGEGIPHQEILREFGLRTLAASGMRKAQDASERGHASLFYKNLLSLVESNPFVDRAFGSVPRFPGEVPVAGTNGLCSEDLLNPRNHFRFSTLSEPFNSILNSAI
jgi:hypothetical protein